MTENSQPTAAGMLQEEGIILNEIGQLLEGVDPEVQRSIASRVFSRFMPPSKPFVEITSFEEEAAKAIASDLKPLLSLPPPIEVEAERLRFERLVEAVVVDGHSEKMGKAVAEKAMAERPDAGFRAQKNLALRLTGTPEFAKKHARPKSAQAKRQMGKASPAIRETVEFVEKKGECGTREVQMRFGLTSAAASARLTKAAELKLVRKTGRGKWAAR